MPSGWESNLAEQTQVELARFLHSVTNLKNQTHAPNVTISMQKWWFADSCVKNNKNPQNPKNTMVANERVWSRSRLLLLCRCACRPADRQIPSGWESTLAEKLLFV
jgi:hypothetical protein